jgi:RNA recognition motif-containing protein
MFLNDIAQFASTKKSRGFGFVKFDRDDIAERVCGLEHELYGYKVSGRSIIPLQPPQLKRGIGMPNIAHHKLSFASWQSLHRPDTVYFID